MEAALTSVEAEETIAAGTSSASNSISNDADGSAGRSGSALAGFTRALVGTLAFLFKRPIRLFRPVKISTWTGLQAIAEEQGRRVTPAFVRGLIRQEGWRFFPKHILPPLMINTSIGFTLFGVYTLSESLLTPHFSPASFISTNIYIPFISGAFAGASQSLLSAPLDNARLLLLRRQRLLRLHTRASSSVSHAARLKRHLALSSTKPFVSWWALMRDSVFFSASSSPSLAVDDPSEKGSRRKRALARARGWARSGWNLWGLSLSKDAIGFGAFFAIFEVGREGAKQSALAYDNFFFGPNNEDEETMVVDGRRRSKSR